MVLTHFIVSDDVERSKRFYTEVLGGRVERPGDPVNVALANSWIVINAGGGPTDDKSARGAQFLTPPKQHQYEKRCYIRDPDGHLIELGQTTDPVGDWTPDHWPSGTPAQETE
jgi:catechol 2,3-dioxygenase-like lactoylglutathione lyase family enzyme